MFRIIFNFYYYYSIFLCRAYHGLQPIMIIYMHIKNMYLEIDRLCRYEDVLFALLVSILTPKSIQITKLDKL